MNIVIVGYGEMLEALILGVMNSSDKISGVFRVENVRMSSIHRIFYDFFNLSSDFNIVQKYNLYDIKAKSVNCNDFRKIIKRLDTDIILVGSWCEKFSPDTINTPKKACINVHPSLLPKYRGPNPYMQVILHNENTTGISFHLMDDGYDTGKIIHQVRTKVFPNDTGLSLKLRSCDIVKNEIPYLLDNIDDKLETACSQNKNEASYQRRVPLKDCILDFQKETSAQIERKVRAFYPWMKCFIPYNNEFISFSQCSISDEITTKEPAQIIKISDNSLQIVCADNKSIIFSNLRVLNPFYNKISRFYIKNFVKINSKAV